MPASRWNQRGGGPCLHEYSQGREEEGHAFVSAVLRGRSSQRLQRLGKVLIAVFEGGAMVPRASQYDEVRGWDCETGGSCAAGNVEAQEPDVPRCLETGQVLLVLADGAPLGLPRDAVPELETHQITPGCFPVGKERAYACSNGSVAFSAERLDPAGSINKRHSAASSLDSVRLAKAEQLLPGHEAIERSEVLGEPGHAAAMVVLVEGCKHAIPLGTRPGVPHGFREDLIRNIYRRLHASRLAYFGIHCKHMEIPPQVQATPRNKASSTFPMSSRPRAAGRSFRRVVQDCVPGPGRGESSSERVLRASPRIF